MEKVKNKYLELNSDQYKWKKKSCKQVQVVLIISTDIFTHIYGNSNESII